MKLQEPSNHSAIIYENPSQSIFILDIPRSIELAQQLQSSQSLDGVPRLLSCSPMQAPYPGPSPEPKTDAARQRVVERTPVSEREFHASIVPIVSTALEHVRQDHSGHSWCFTRKCISNTEDEDIDEGKKDVVSPNDPKRSCQKRKRQNSWDTNSARQDESCIISACKIPPVILAPGSNAFPSISSIRGSIIKNPSTMPVVLQFTSKSPSVISIPPKSTFLNAHITTSSSYSLSPPLIPKFNLILLDPPWPNRSVHRSMHYHSTPSFHTLHLLIKNLITMHLQPEVEIGGSSGIVGIWTTNSAKSRAAVHDAFREAHLEIFEEWIWVKCTTEGKPVLPLDGVWRRPYEVLIWGQRGRRRRRRGSDHHKNAEVERKQRVIFAVPDIHSRKPNLKELIERVFFAAGSTCPPTSQEEKMGRREGGDRVNNNVCEYTALEVFARNLTAGWWACGDEVLRFNCDRWWSDQ